MTLHLRHRRDFAADAGKLSVGEAIRPVLCGAPKGSRWTFVETAGDATPFAFVMPFAWEGVALCADCVREVKP